MRGLLLSAAMAAIPGGGYAQTAEPAAPAWQLSCDTNGACRMGQNFVAGGQTVSRLLIYKVGDQNIVEGLLPLGFSQLEPLSIVVDDQAQFPLRVVTCKATGCLAFSADADKIIDAFRLGLEAKLAFTGFDDGKPYHYPFSLIGFSAVYGDYQAQD